MSLFHSGFSDEELRKLANINLQTMMELCVLLNEKDTLTFLDYIITGAQAFRQGFTEGEPDK